MVYDPEKLEEVRGKLSKLLALAGSSNENEARLAMERAATIAAKYEIELGEVEVHDKAMSEMVDVPVESLRHYPTYVDRWESVLSGVIGNTFDCSNLVNRKPSVWTFHFLGRKSDVSLAVHFYSFIRKTIHEEGKKQFSGLKDRSDYCMGMITTITNRLEAMYKRKTEIIKESGSLALVLQKKKDADDFRDQLYKNMKKGKTVSTRNVEAYFRGLEDGHKVELNRPIREGDRVEQVR